MTRGRMLIQNCLKQHDFAAVKREELKSHLEAVHRDRDYQCDKCDFTAIKREELNSHVEAVYRDGDYQCDKYMFAAVTNK